MPSRYLIKEDFNDPEFMNQTYQNGIMNIALKNYDGFTRITDKVTCEYVWRGHQDKSWKLKSYFDREIEDGNILPKGEKRDEKLKDILSKFKQRLGELKGHIEIDKLIEIDIWAIGQHYGLPTPLLDWTTNPFIAAFIAFRKKDLKTQSSDRVIIALNQNVKRLMGNKKLKGVTLRRDRFIEFPGITERVDSRLNDRMKAQEGIFTKSLNGENINSNIEKYFNKREFKGNEILLLNIFIPNSDRDLFLKYLKNDKGIFHGSIFPDFNGAVEITKDEIYFK